MSNNSDSPCECWIWGRHVGNVESKSKADLSVAFPSDDSEVVDIVCVDESSGRIAMNGLVVKVPKDRHVIVRWGTVDDVRLPPTPDGSVIIPKFDELVNRRRSGARYLVPGRPVEFDDTLLGTKFQDKTIVAKELSASSANGTVLSNRYGIVLVKLSGGVFTLAQQDKTGARSASITRDFYMSITEVTNAQYAYICSSEMPQSKEFDLPKTDVSWDDCTAACERMIPPAGWSYVLPTEAQWEFACQSGTLRPFAPAGQPLGMVMWYGTNSNGAPTKVGTFLPNDYGLYDMHGNVREWCLEPIPEPRIRYLASRE